VLLKYLILKVYPFYFFFRLEKSLFGNLIPNRLFAGIFQCLI
jgi:hypothetical protein